MLFFYHFAFVCLHSATLIAVWNGKENMNIEEVTTTTTKTPLIEWKRANKYYKMINSDTKCKWCDFIIWKNTFIWLSIDIQFVRLTIFWCLSFQFFFFFFYLRHEVSENIAWFRPISHSLTRSLSLSLLLIYVFQLIGAHQYNNYTQ